MARFLNGKITKVDSFKQHAREANQFLVLSGLALSISIAAFFYYAN